jgi:hypothetical protein
VNLLECVTVQSRLDCGTKGATEVEVSIVWVINRFRHLLGKDDQ